MKQQTVVVLGASPKPERYSNKAVNKLIKYGHQVYPVHPISEKIHEQKCYKYLSEIDDKIDTLTLYVSVAKSTALINDIFILNPKRIIMNPGTENDLLESQAVEKGIEVIRGCTLVMLDTKQF
ncbi:MAG: CoA-binding protein [Thiomargarita sp.]|nr:CoA-binding protein [Thiomargarita sp.]